MLAECAVASSLYSVISQAKSSLTLVNSLNERTLSCQVWMECMRGREDSVWCGWNACEVDSFL